MTGRRIDIFFYGLFMDREVLRESGVLAENPRRACVEGFRLCLGQRATLVPSTEARAYGVVFELTHLELERLYTAPGLEAYRPEAVIADLLQGGTLPALCYNLPEAPDAGEADARYAEKLRAVLGDLDFPAHYIEAIT